ncbi:hypothetical protein VLL09_04810 [Dehalococcoides mccartyi]|uniref:Uncharacterized protein n=1 Tax=Dehalococcoides mccartyi TaxID=61435 RepID=A0AB38Z802_9CHLR|nr:hypothetical protein [Dehalococcoides mccartyi]WRO06713.1 hypothetical protein VLL09_04810 [Dehalococcoides mccartyi]
MKNCEDFTRENNKLDRIPDFIKGHDEQWLANNNDLRVKERTR